MNDQYQITGFYSEAGDIELRGNTPALRKLAEALSAHMLPYTIALDIPPKERIAPYDHFLTTIHITHNDGMVNISRIESTLEIVGSKEKLSVLSENLTWLSNNPDLDTEKGTHLHIEYFPGHYYLTESSLPIIIAIRDEP